MRERKNCSQFKKYALGREKGIWLTSDSTDGSKLFGFPLREADSQLLLKNDRCIWCFTTVAVLFDPAIHNAACCSYTSHNACLSQFLSLTRVVCRMAGFHAPLRLVNGRLLMSPQGAVYYALCTPHAPATHYSEPKGLF